MRKSHDKAFLSKLVGVAVTLLAYIQEMPGCDPNWVVWCPGRLSWLGKCWYSPSLRLQLFPFSVFPVYYSWIVLQMMLCSSRGIQIFQKSRSSCRITGIRWVKNSKFHSEDPHICALVWNLVMQVTCAPLLCSLSHWWHCKVTHKRRAKTTVLRQLAMPSW